MLTRLLHGALSRCDGLLLLPDARLLEMLALTYVGKDSCLLALFLEALHRVLEGLTVLDTHGRHRLITPLYSDAIEDRQLGGNEKDEPLDATVGHEALPTSGNDDLRQIGEIT